MLNALKRGKERRLLAERLHEAVVARAREPVFFAALGVKDTLDGRFDLVVLHAWLVLERLNPSDAALSQAFVDALFVGFDEGLRELGAGDIGMGRRVKKMAEAFYGRLKAYGEAKGEAEMQAALIRNLYRGEAHPGAEALTRYVFKAKTYVAESALGRLVFGPLPGEDRP